MDQRTFSEVVSSKFQEGEYIYLDLDRDFYKEAQKEKDKMFQKPEPPKGLKGKFKQLKEKILPSKNKTTPIPAFAFGRVYDLLPSCVVLDQAHQDGLKETLVKGWEHREIRAVRKLSQKDYESLKKLV